MITTVKVGETVRRAEQLTLGIDEAGRGPVVGPLVYAGFVCIESDWPRLRDTLGAKDSKQMTSAAREEFIALAEKESERYGWIIHETPAENITTAMLSEGRSLNELSRDAAVSIIRKALLEEQLQITHVHVDALGNCQDYEEFLTELFPSVRFTVREKADALYPHVSAASIFAKVTRDKAIEAFAKEYACSLGSGYPGDADTQAFLRSHFDPLYGFPRIVRFSWQTARILLEQLGLPVTWPLKGTPAGRLETFFAGDNNKQLVDLGVSAPKESIFTLLDD